MLSEKQLIANRNNALKSTGPRSFEGKRIVARNAVRHGLLSSPDLTVIKGEDRTEFTDFSSNLLADLKPVGQLETLLAERITSFFWRLKRTGRMEKELLDLLTVPGQADSNASRKDLPFTMILHKTYETPLKDPEYQDFLKFKKAQAEYANMEVEEGEILDRETFYKFKNQFELPSPQPVPAAQPQVMEPEALGKAVKEDFKGGKLLDKLLRYEGQIERSMYRAMLELNKLQFIRTRSEALEVAPDVETDNTQSSPLFQGGVSRSGEGVLNPEGKRGLVRSDEGGLYLSPLSDPVGASPRACPIDTAGGTFKPQACGCSVAEAFSFGSTSIAAGDSSNLQYTIDNLQSPNKPILPDSILSPDLCRAESVVSFPISAGRAGSGHADNVAEVSSFGSTSIAAGDSSNLQSTIDNLQSPNKPILDSGYPIGNLPSSMENSVDPVNPVKAEVKEPKSAKPFSETQLPNYHVGMADIPRAPVYQPRPVRSSDTWLNRLSDEELDRLTQEIV